MTQTASRLSVATSVYSVSRCRLRACGVSPPQPPSGAGAERRTAMAPARVRHPRRQFLQGALVVAGAGLLSACGVALGPAAQTAPHYRIGNLVQGSLESSVANLEAFRQGLRELGYAEDRDVLITHRYADGREDRLAELAAELVRVDVD